MGSSLIQSADYQQTLGDETEDLYQLLKLVKVALILFTIYLFRYIIFSINILYRKIILMFKQFLSAQFYQIINAFVWKICNVILLFLLRIFSYSLNLCYERHYLDVIALG